METLSLKKALVIDTDAAFRQFVTLRLEILGYRVKEAENPAQIREAVRAGHADLVVTEYAVPGLEGLQLLNALEPSKRNVFLLTEWVSENLQSFLEKTGVRAVISKKRKSDFFKQLEYVVIPVRPLEADEGRAVDGKHVLLIEDSPTIRNYVRRTLEKALPNCVIREAEDGREAISEMAQKKVDLIITDLQMPGMDGHAFLRMIRKNNLLKQKPVLVLSGSDWMNLRVEFGADPCMEFLPKPSSQEQILAAIGKLWQRQDDLLPNMKR